MNRQRSYYVIKIQFLGFRYSGWQKQPRQKTVELMLTKTLKFILPNVRFKILGAGRTDAKVSALQTAFELFLDNYSIADHEEFLRLFNTNLPSDIRVLDIKEVDSKYNIIKDPKTKEYVYLFSNCKKNHPFSAPFMTNVTGTLNLDLMKKAAGLYEGSHDFSSYTVKAQNNASKIRNISACEIKENKILKANFFPKQSYALHVKGKGFVRYQIRMMMGALIQLGRGELGYEDIVKSLESPGLLHLTYVAPGSGLLLYNLELDL